MPIPASVIQALETNNIAYQLKATQTHIEASRTKTLTDAPSVCHVKSLILQDSQSKIQVLLPENYLVDLNAVEQEFGRKLMPVPLAELKALLDQQGLKTIPALPDWHNFATIADASLMRYQTLLLDCGDNDQSIEITLAGFKSIIKNTSIGEMATRAPALPDSAEMDQEQIFDSLKNFTQLRIKQRLVDTLEMPPLQETAQQIIQLRADPDADISDLSDIVELDPSLAAQVVSWASSPYYSAPGKIKSVHDAIVRVLGFDMVLNLSLGLALGNSMHINVLSANQISNYWRQSVCTAATVEALVTSIPKDHRPGFGMAYLSGLMNNFGYLILAEIFPPYFNNISRHLEVNTHIPTASVEQHLLGVSSCQMASWLMEIWNMPEEVVIALRHQNNPHYDGQYKVYAKLLFLARQLLANNGIGRGAYQNIPDSVFTSLHLDRETAETSARNIVESADDLNAIAEKMRS